jgi:hypothetical protein
VLRALSLLRAVLVRLNTIRVSSWFPSARGSGFRGRVSNIDVCARPGACKNASRGDGLARVARAMFSRVEQQPEHGRGPARSPHAAVGGQLVLRRSAKLIERTVDLRRDVTCKVR